MQTLCTSRTGPGMFWSNIAAGRRCCLWQAFLQLPLSTLPTCTAKSFCLKAILWSAGTQCSPTRCGQEAGGLACCGKPPFGACFHVPASFHVRAGKFPIAAAFDPCLTVFHCTMSCHWAFHGPNAMTKPDAPRALVAATQPMHPTGCLALVPLTLQVRCRALPYGCPCSA